MAYAIRRDLRKGKTNGHFQVRHCDSPKKLGDVIDYIDGTKFNIIMHNCLLYNNVNVSEKIFTGRYPKKRPCAWIVCEYFEIVEAEKISSNKVTFNPRVRPNYILNGENVDNKEYKTLIQYNNNIYL